MSQVEKVDFMGLLRQAISEGKKQMVVEEYQDQISDAEILGTLVSKFSKWDISEIVKVLEYALEDSNFKLSDLKEYL